MKRGRKSYITLNLSGELRKVDIPFTFSGTWYELLNEEVVE